MRSIVITGGAGYIGSHIAKACFDEGWEVFVLDNFSTGYREPLDILKKHGSMHSYEVDLRKKDSVMSVFKKLSDKRKIDVVIHCAAFCSVGDSMARPELYFENNVGGTINLLLAMKEFGFDKIIFSSSCAVYGEAQYLPIDEEHPLNPINPYGHSKKVSEDIIKWSNEIKHVILRYFNVCGADYATGIGDSKRPSPHLVQNIVRGVLGIEEFELTSPKVATKDKSPIRDYLDVRDLARAHILAANYLDENDSTVFNLGTGRGHSNLEIVRKVEEVLSCKIKIGRGFPRPGEYAEVHASYDKAKELLRWVPKIELTESIKSLEEWYQSRPSGYDY